METFKHAARFFSYTFTVTAILAMSMLILLGGSSAPAQQDEHRHGQDRRHGEGVREEAGGVLEGFHGVSWGPWGLTRHIYKHDFEVRN